MTVTLLRGGRVHSPADPYATALLIADGEVAWVGADGAAEGYADGADEVIELHDAFVAPAFVDAHVHTTATGLALDGLDLTGCPSLAEALDRLAAHARERRGGIVLGHGWDDTRWPERRPPTSAELDRASYGGVVYLARTDAHSAVASSALLAVVPEARGLTGFAGDGLVRQEAHHAVRAAAYASLSTPQRRAAQRRARARAAALGIGCLHECGGPAIAGEEDFTGLLALAAEEPGPEVIGYWGELGAVAKASALGARGAAGDLFVDGSLGSHTACVHGGYADLAGTGELFLPPERSAAHLIACTEAGVQAGFHAIGDAALRGLLLEAFPAAAAAAGLDRLRALRHRVEHAEMLDRELIAALARFGVVASVQPAFDAFWGGSDRMYAQRLGARRAATMNPFAALLAAGVPLAFGSDAPVTPLDPWGALRAAIHHRTPEHRISARAAFAAHTRGGRRAAGDDRGGVLVPGAPATLAIWRLDSELVVQTPDERVAEWSTDPRGGVPGLPDLTEGSPDPLCLRTLVRGVTVFEHEGAASR